MLKLLVVAFCVSAILGFALLRMEYLGRGWFADAPDSAGHKVHRYAVPRLGGVLISAGLFAALVGGMLVKIVPTNAGLLLLLCALPVFGAGLVEDIFGGVRPGVRLMTSFLSAMLGIVLLGATVTRLDLPGVDNLLTLAPLAGIFTLVAVGGVTQSLNIIDGLNGLAGGISVLVLGALTYVSYIVGDHELAQVSIATLGAVLGFLIWNYPSGQIFCGDGGAYLLGFLIAEISVLLVVRHPQVAAWFPLLLLSYPIWETVFSMYRRRVLRRKSAARADRLHLHTLMYKRLPYGINYARTMGRRRQRNSDISVYAWLLAALGAAPAVFLWREPYWLMLCAALFAIFYGWLYRRLVRFRIERRQLPLRMRLPECNTD